MSEMNPEKKFKVIIGCGGTGGHIYPGLVIADSIKARIPNSDILFVGAEGRMEMQMVPEAGYPIKGLNIRGFNRKSFLKNLALPFKIVHSIWQAKRILRAFNPSVVIGTGGYASAPILFVASLQKMPTIIHEQNAIAGLTNKLLGRYVDKVCLAYESANLSFPKKKVILTGTPVRKDIVDTIQTNRKDAYKYFDLKEDKNCLLVFGGSLGTKSINDCIMNSLDSFIEKGIQLIWVTGIKYYDHINLRLNEAYKSSIKIFPFIKDMSKAYAAADVIISRGGAVSIAELCLVKKPVIFVPSPNTTNDHQTKNIAPMVAEGAAIAVSDSKIDLHLVERAFWLLGNKIKREQMVEKLKKWANHSASDIIVTELIRMA
jgi:UDP-N-acetylglucosamine--N-acetylmuramyl-(pentapeptide) pyrophosphoryl-undecaprenol N-acetylglucosamine transferase